MVVSVSPRPSSKRLRSWSSSQLATNERTKKVDRALGRSSRLPLTFSLSRAVTVTLFFTFVGYDTVRPLSVIGRQLSLYSPSNGVFRFENEPPSSQPTVLCAALPVTVASSAYGTSLVSAGEIEIGRASCRERVGGRGVG